MNRGNIAIQFMEEIVILIGEDCVIFEDEQKELLALAKVWRRINVVGTWIEKQEREASRDE